MHAAARLVRRRRDQGRARGRRRHHARPAARHPGRGQPLLHDAEPQQALDHRRREEPEGQGGSRRRSSSNATCWSRTSRPGALDRMGFTWERIQALNPADDRRVGQGLRPGTVRGLQGLRERRAVRGRLGVDDRLRRRSAARDRRADRRQRNGPASGTRHRRGALPAQHDRPRPASARRDAGRRAEPLSREAARPAAPRAHGGHGGVSAVSERRVRRRRAARRQRVGRRPAGLDPEVQGLGNRSQRVHLFHHAGARVEGHLQGHRPRGMADRSALRDAQGRACRT